MTNEEVEEPEATTGSSNTRTESDANRERSERPEEPETATETEFSNTRTESDAKGGRSERRDEDFYTDGGKDDIPLNIAGHEDREPPGSNSSDAPESPGDGSVLEFSEDDDLGGDVDVEDGQDEDDEVEPVELLVQLAKDGEIDPWDIDIVAVTDKFLEAIEDADLRTSGRALFYASVLLRMKSDELFAPDEPEEDELPPWEAPFADEGPMDGGEDGSDGGPPGFDPVEGLEAEMERRLERKQARGKPETLDELVRELRGAERGTWWKESRTYDTSDSPRGYDRGMQELNYHSGDDFRVDDEPTSDDVTHTTHEEDIEAVIDDVESELESQYEQGREEVLYAEIDGIGGTRVMTYLALLFLAHRGRVRLEQDELFGDLWVQDATVETEATEAVAD
ncbi:segregation and condensation protein A [Natronorubrum texcoconense]|uniref:Condensin subunit ScpA n=1 Tax=Natronorubrum texcoconense TaxID=1095776 RepID=A0A1G8WZD3_9EURY|nr:ScpA family protein [Natronorubrum texcoconense]SDJ83633.1 condensin subunit ScpA [Natronorubrum texcoconense]